MSGIAVEIPTRGRPTARMVTVDDSTGAPSIVASDEFTSDSVDVPKQLHDAAEAVRSRLVGTEVERVVIRRADRPPRPSNNEGPKLRLLMEGAVISAARSVVVRTVVGTGKDLGSWSGTNKATASASATALCSAGGLKPAFAEAVSAALTAFLLQP